MGSTVGTGIGTGVSLLLMKAGAEADPNGDRYDRRSDPESEAAATLVLAGFAAILAGGPVGAVEGGDIERRRDAYVAAGVGEFVVGVAGYALATRLHGSTPSRLIGLGVGAALGAAGGAYWVASQEKREGLLSYQEEWQITPPDVRVRPNLAKDRSPSVNVALVSVQF